MPIHPDNVARYGPDWPAITWVIKWIRAGSRCECDGRCGRPADHLDALGRCRNVHGQPAHGTGSTVVLTTAHLDHTPENMHPSNLLAACQGCHLHYDREHHAETRRTRRQLELADAGVHPFDIAALLDTPLTARQTEVLGLLADGLTRPEVAARLAVALSTVTDHVREVLDALKARNTTHAVAVAVREGILQ